jgi:hypothetical protein
LLGDVLAPYVIRAIESGDGGRVQRVSVFMERMATSADNQVRNALTVSLLERLGDDPDRLHATSGVNPERWGSAAPSCPTYVSRPQKRSTVRDRARVSGPIASRISSSRRFRKPDRTQDLTRSSSTGAFLRDPTAEQQKKTIYDDV